MPIYVPLNETKNASKIEKNERAQVASPNLDVLAQEKQLSQVPGDGGPWPRMSSLSSRLSPNG